MKLVLALLLVASLAAVVLILYVRRRLKRLAESPHTATLVESFDDGLAIPMRDGNTRRPARTAETEPRRKAS